MQKFFRFLPAANELAGEPPPVRLCIPKGDCCMNEHTQFETIEASRRDLLLLAASVTVMAVTPSLAFSA